MTAGGMSPLTLTLKGPCELQGSLQVPGDKSVSHRALLLAAVAEGQSTIVGLSNGDDVLRTRGAVEALGIEVVQEPGGNVVVNGGSVQEPQEPLDHGNSGTGIRLTAGLLAGYDFLSILTGDEFLRRRPMDRVAVPLRAMGAFVDGRRSGSLPPLVIRGGPLRGITYESPVASAQVKSAVLLAGLHAEGPTTVVEPVATRRHTEEMLLAFGAHVEVDGLRVTVRGGPLTPTTVVVPGDPSQAAFWVVAALIAPGSSVEISQLYLGHGRDGFVRVLAGMGAAMDVDRTHGTIAATSGPLRGLDVDHGDLASFIDEVPVLAVAAAAGEGTTVFRGAGELRVKESDRLATTVAMLKAFGVAAHDEADSMVIEGGTKFRGGEVDSHGDHRIAMAAAVAALRAEGVTTIRGWESVATSYPSFADEVNRLTNGAAGATVTRS